MADWFRRSTWSQEDEVEFYNKLKRAQKWNRPQYLRIQAVHLYRTKNRRLLRVAESLACKVLTDYPDAEFIQIEIAPTYELLGNIYKELGENDKAITHYQKALETEESYPNVTTDAYLNYAELIIKTKNVNLFESVEKILLKREPNAIFPIHKYKIYIILAIINKYREDDSNVQKYMSLAKQNSDAQTSGFRYHKNLGLVRKADRWLETAL